MAIGFVLLIVPGLILLTWWALIAPVVYFDLREIEAADRAAQAAAAERPAATT
jgi:hypothetical protein